MNSELKIDTAKYYPIKHTKLNTLGIYSSDDFLSHTFTHYMRLILSHKIGKSLEKINKLTAYFDLLRLEGLSPQLADCMVEYGIRGVQSLRKYEARFLFQEIVSRFPRVRDITSEKRIEAYIIAAKNINLLVFDLQNDDFEIKNTSYSSQKNKQQDVYYYVKHLSKKELISFVIQCSIILVLGVITPYFLVCIPILFLFHFYKNSYFISSFQYKLRSILERNISTQYLSQKQILQYIQTNFIIIKKLFSLLGIGICVGIFFLGLNNGSIPNAITNFFITGKPTPSDLGAKYIAPDIFERYQGKEITRAELIGILFYAQKDDRVPGSYSSCFGDISNSVYAEQICYAKTQGYIQGDALNNFNPDGVVSHAAGLKFILNFSGINIPNSTVYVSYEDLKRGEWFTSYAEYAKTHNIIDSSVTNFGPHENLSIEQVDEYLYKIQK